MFLTFIYSHFLAQFSICSFNRIFPNPLNDLPPNFIDAYWLFEKFCPLLYMNSLYTNGQDFLHIQHVFSVNDNFYEFPAGSPLFVTVVREVLSISVTILYKLDKTFWVPSMLSLSTRSKLAASLRIRSSQVCSYRVSKMSIPFLYRKSLHKNGEDFLDIQFV